MGCSSSSNAKAVQEPVKPPVADAKPAQTSSAPPKKEETPTPVEKPVEEQPKVVEALEKKEKEEEKEKEKEKEEKKEQEKEKEEKEKETQGNAKNEFEPLPVPTEEVTEHRERPNLVWAKNPMAEGEEEKEQTGGEAPAEGEKMISFNPILLPVPPAEGGSAVQLYCPLTSVEELSGLSVLVLLRENKIPHDLKKESIAEPERKMPVYLDDGGLHLWCFRLSPFRLLLLTCFPQGSQRCSALHLHQGGADWLVPCRCPEESDLRQCARVQRERADANDGSCAGELQEGRRAGGRSCEAGRRKVPQRRVACIESSDPEWGRTPAGRCGTQHRRPRRLPAHARRYPQTTRALRVAARGSEELPRGSARSPPLLG
uniref:Uncharacterized protein n=1 Tax=Guillardia theta TaxID=55529 RepID=A0A7S4KGH6_GUITH|mmetsp:Transcript_24397/g.79675  ORF Transcript_24397/g.79675 Transcript_24397/m.79675 type:complete len:372 (+) Transcript_24397:382-1497(+)